MHLLVDADVHAPEPLGHRHVLVAGETVVWMGAERPDLPASLGVAVHDVGGRRLVPGFVDCHVHPTGGGGEAGFESRGPAVPLSRFTSAGVTTIVGVLGTDDAIRSPADLVARVRALHAEGISGFCLTGGYHVPVATVTGSVKGDILHVDPVLGVGEVAISDRRSSQPTLDELLRIAADAHVAGLLADKAGLVQLHVGAGERGLDLVRRAVAESELPPRTFHPTHVNRAGALFEEALDLVRAGGAVDVSAFPPDDAYPDELSVSRACRLFLDAGLPRDALTVSSDAGGSLPVFDAEGRAVRMGVGAPAQLADALAAALADGLPLADVLPAFTLNVAQLYRLGAKGRIAPGADADLVVLDEDGHPADVMARGRWHVRAGETLVRGTFEQP